MNHSEAESIAVRYGQLRCSHGEVISVNLVPAIGRPGQWFLERVDYACTQDDCTLCCPAANEFRVSGYWNLKVERLIESISNEMNQFDDSMDNKPKVILGLRPFQKAERR